MPTTVSHPYSGLFNSTVQKNSESGQCPLGENAVCAHTIQRRIRELFVKVG